MPIKFLQEQIVFTNPKRKHPLWEWLVKNKMSQSELAERLGVSRPMISYWLYGQKEPNLYRVLQMFYITNGYVKLTDFICLDDKKKLARFAGVPINSLL